MKANNPWENSPPRQYNKQALAAAATDADTMASHSAAIQNTLL